MERSAANWARRVVVGLALTLSITGAAPAAGSGDNVLVVAPTSVEVPAKLPGDCHVNAKVLEVWAGSGFKTGRAIAIDVPCSDRAPVFDQRPLTRSPPGGEPPAKGLDPVVLRRSSRGYVHLDDSGRLIWTPAPRGFGGYGVAFGYRVLDGVKLPAEGPVAA